VTPPRVAGHLLRTCVLLLIVGAVVTFSACRGGSSTPDDAAPPEDEPGESTEVATAEADVEEPSVSPLPRKGVKIYFPSALKNGLIGEFREIFATSVPGDRAKQIVADLISGPRSSQAMRALPPDVRLRQAYVLASGVAYLDFNAALTEGVGGGSMEELLVVYSIVDSVVLNIPEIKRVGILVNGQPLETLNGHIDLRHPLPADRELILGSIVVMQMRLVGPSAA